MNNASILTFIEYASRTYNEAMTSCQHFAWIFLQYE